MELNTPKRIKTLKTIVCSPGSEYGADLSDCIDANTNNTITGSLNDTNSGGIGMNMGTGSLSPASSCDSPEFSTRQNNANGYSIYAADGRENRRGRPRSEALTTLMIEGSTSPSAIKCTYCNRVFPREKSLQAHLRTHTGERPYLCDYPGCTRAFTQSGQLKTHQRLHTGERPFMCSAPRCQMRFTHANRHCPEHPYDQLKRCDDFVIQANTEQNNEVFKWLEKYKMEKEVRTPTHKTPKRIKNSLCDSLNFCSNEKSNENYNGSAMDENNCPITPSNKFKCRKGLMVELDMNAGLGASPITGNKMKPTPKVIRWQEPLSQEEDSADEHELPARSTFNPKKRWLREAWQDDLAKPLESIVNVNLQTNSSNNNIRTDSLELLTSSSSTTLSSSSSLLLSQTQLHQPKMDSHLNLNPNEMRPTVLMVASKDRTMPLLNLISTPNENRNQLSIIQPRIATSKFSNRANNTSYDIAAAASLPNTPSSPSLQNISISYNPINTVIYGDHCNADNSSNFNTVENATTNKTLPTDSVKNRKWLGALALMQLATDENSPVSLNSLSSSISLSSLPSSSPSLSSSSSSSISSSPTTLISDDAKINNIN